MCVYKYPLSGTVACSPAVRLRSDLVARTWVGCCSQKEEAISVVERVVRDMVVTGRLLTTSERGKERQGR